MKHRAIGRVHKVGWFFANVEIGSNGKEFVVYSRTGEKIASGSTVAEYPLFISVVTFLFRFFIFAGFSCVIGESVSHSEPLRLLIVFVFVWACIAVVCWIDILKVINGQYAVIGDGITCTVIPISRELASVLRNISQRVSAYEYYRMMKVQKSEPIKGEEFPEDTR